MRGWRFYIFEDNFQNIYYLSIYEYTTNGWTNVRWNGNNIKNPSKNQNLPQVIMNYIKYKNIGTTLIKMTIALYINFKAKEVKWKR
jgi:hypothetical protein